MTSALEETRQSTAIGAKVSPSRRVLAFGVGTVVFAIGSAVLLLIINPLVTVYTPQVKVTKATAEKANIELAFEKLCGDAGVRSVRELFLDPSLLDRADLKAAVAFHTEAAYALLCRGRNAECAFAPGIKERLGTLYMDLPKDPWGRPYQFFFPPWPEEGIGDTKTDPFARYLTNGNSSGGANKGAPLVYVISMGPDGKLDALSAVATQPQEMTPHDDITNLAIDSPARNAVRK